MEQLREPYSLYPADPHDDDDCEALPGAAHQHHHAVFSVLAQVLDKDELSPTEFEEKDRPRDDYINHDLLRAWFKRRLRVAGEHRMSLREIWRNFCYEYQIYCSLPLFGNVVLRHVLQAEAEWSQVTKTGDIKQKRYNLAWVMEPPGTEDELDLFFARIKEEKEKAEKVSVKPEAANPKSSAMFLDPVVLAKWWLKSLEPSEPAVCRMRMRDVYERFVAETQVNMPKALFGELSVRYVLSLPQFSPVVKRGKIHNKRYSLRWKNDRVIPNTTPNASPTPSPSASTEGMSGSKLAAAWSDDALTFHISTLNKASGSGLKPDHNLVSAQC